MALDPGKRLGRYEILGPIGAGGMGEVYRARDTRLGRQVAVKVLPAEFSADGGRLRRFELEACAASALNHPNILTIHDVGSHEGVFYVVSELLDGETLRSRLAKGPLAVSETINFILQMARGLAAAHDKGIIHRDLKPENLFIAKDGLIKILDFGLAKLTRPEQTGKPDTELSTLTGPGRVLGTVGYMSPEQVRGQATDHRSDIFVLGIVLHEMLSGRNPFRADTAPDTMTAILTDDPPGPGDAQHRVPEPLVRIVRRCLEKQPERRFQHASDLGFTLEALARAPHRPASDRDISRDEGSTGKGRTIAVAVMPFRDLSRDGENDHLGLGLADATITELALVRSLVVRPTTAILRYQEHAITAEEAGGELGVDVVVEGTFQRAGARLRVMVQLIDSSDGASLWGTKVDSSMEDIFQMQDEVSRKIAQALKIELSPADERRLARAAHPGGEAYEHYLKGRFHLLRETIPDINTAIEHFERARDADPGSALPLAGLAEAYARMAYTFDPEGDWHERSERMCQKALALDGWLPEGRFLRGFLVWSPRGGWDHAAALKEFLAAVKGRPSLIEGYDRLGVVLFHVSLFDEALHYFDRALSIDPEDTMAATHLASCGYLQGRYENALERCESIMKRAPWSWAAYQLALCQHRLGLLDAAVRSTDVASRQFPGDVLFYSIRGLIAASRGEETRAREQVQLTIRNEKLFGHYHHAQYDIACIHALLGEKDQALDWLERAARNGFPCHSFFERDPALQTVRDDGRFVRLMGELRAECDGYRRLVSGADQGSDPPA